MPDLAEALRTAGGAGRPAVAPPPASAKKETPFDERDLQQIVPVIMRELYFTDGGGVSKQYVDLTAQVQSILRDLATVRHNHNDKVFVAVLKAFSRFEQDTHKATTASSSSRQGGAVKRKEADFGPARAARRQRRAELHQHMMQMKNEHDQQAYGANDPEL